MFNKNNIKVGISMMLLSLVFILLIYIIPTLHIFIFLIGVPMVILGYLTDLKIQLVVSFIIALLVAFINVNYSFSILFTIMAMSLAVGYFIREKTSKAILYGTIVGVFGTIISIYLIKFLYDFDVIESLSKLFDSQIESTEALYKSIEGVNPSDISRIISVLKEAKKGFMISIPAIIFIESIITSSLLVAVSKKALISRKYKLTLGEFKNFRIGSEHKYIILTVMLIIGILSLIDSNNSEFYITNTMIIFSFIFELCGLSYLLYRTDEKKKKHLKVFVIIIFILSFIIAPLSLIISLIGVADLFINLRKIRRSNEK